MKAPRRWLDDVEGLSSREREVLRAGRSMEPPAGAEAAVWAAMAAKIAAGGALGAAAASGVSSAGGVASGAAGAGGASGLAGGGAAAGGSGAVSALGSVAGAGLVKSVLIGAGSALVVISTYAAVSPSAPEARPALAAPSATVSPAGVIERARPLGGPRGRAEAPAAEVEVPTSPASAMAPPVDGAGGAPPSAAVSPRASDHGRTAAGSARLAVDPPLSASAEAVLRETRLREESQLVAEARAALRSGDAAGALAKLGALSAKIPGGVLGQEREALAIEALARSGRRDEARARARAFVAAHPSSTLAERVAAFAN